MCQINRHARSRQSIEHLQNDRANVGVVNTPLPHKLVAVVPVASPGLKQRGLASSGTPKMPPMEMETL